MGSGPKPGSATSVSKHWARPPSPLNFLLDKHKENSRLPFLRTQGEGKTRTPEDVTPEERNLSDRTRHADGLLRRTRHDEAAADSGRRTTSRVQQKTRCHAFQRCISHEDHLKDSLLGQFTRSAGLPTSLIFDQRVPLCSWLGNSPVNLWISKGIQINELKTTAVSLSSASPQYEIKCHAYRWCYCRRARNATTQTCSLVWRLLKSLTRSSDSSIA